MLKENQHDISKGSLDILHLFMQDLKKIPRLTPEEELTLLEIYEDGKDARAKLEILRSDDSTREIFETMISEADEARKKLIESNLALVVKIAKNFMSRGVELLDLIGAGSIGLNRAIEKFDLLQGCKLSTYAYGWIRKMILQEVENHSRLVDIPNYVYQELNYFFKIWEKLAQDLGSEPTIKQLSEMLKWDEEKTQRIISLIEDAPISINDGIPKKSANKNSDLVFLEDFLEDPAWKISAVEDKIISMEQIHELKTILKDSGLSDKQQHAFLLHNGLKNPDLEDKPLIFSEIGEILGEHKQTAEIHCRDTVKFLQNSQQISALVGFKSKSHSVLSHEKILPKRDSLNHLKSD